MIIFLKKIHHLIRIETIETFEKEILDKEMEIEEDLEIDMIIQEIMEKNNITQGIKVIQMDIPTHLNLV